MTVTLNLKTGCMTETWTQSYLDESTNEIKDVIHSDSLHFGNDHFTKMAMMAIFRERAYYKLRDKRDQFQLIK